MGQLTTTTNTRPSLPQVQLRDGSTVEAYEHGMSLAIVALRGSVPAQWVMDYKSVLGRYAGFSLDQRPQIESIYKVLLLPVILLHQSVLAC